MPARIVPLPPKEVAKADAAAPPVAATEPGISDEWRQPRGEQDDFSSPEIMPASHPPTQEELTQAPSILTFGRTEPPVLIPQPLNSVTDVAPPLGMSRVTPSMVSSGELRSPRISAKHLIAKLSRAGVRALGIAGVGVGLMALIALVHFHRPAKAQAKPVSMAAMALVTQPVSSSLAGPEVRTNPADPRVRSVNLASTVHRGSRTGRPQAAPAGHRQNRENTNLGSAEADVSELTPSSGSSVLTAPSSPPQSQAPSGLGPAPTPVHPETEKEAPPAVASQTPAPPVEISRQIPTVLPSTSSVPADLPAETNQGPVSPAAPAAPNTTEGAPAVQPAKLLSRPALQYPPLALGARVQGDVHLEANIRADGTVASVRVVKGVAMLNDSAVDLVQNSRYQPALVDGHPVRSYVDLTISFRLPR